MHFSQWKCLLYSTSVMLHLVQKYIFRACWEFVWALTKHSKMNTCEFRVLFIDERFPILIKYWTNIPQSLSLLCTWINIKIMYLSFRFIYWANLYLCVKEGNPKRISFEMKNYLIGQLYLISQSDLSEGKMDTNTCFSHTQFSRILTHKPKFK